jgi:predicted acyl esterase
MLCAMARIQRAATKIHRMRHPQVTITPPPPGITFERDVEVPMRDGTILRANIFRPAAPGRYPAILSAHPYGKDRLPRRRRDGTYVVPRQYRLLTQDQDFAHSAWTSWEAPDPAFWVPRGYVLVNADLRGWGRSDGDGELFSAQEGIDGHDLVEWTAAQGWCTGRVGMAGVSYLAITQWRTAATRPPHLAAILPWEGLTDLYRDFAYPGGIREDGFSILWDAMLTVARRRSAGLRRLMRDHPLRDGAWADRDPALEEIEVPALVCGSFSDQSLHTRGSFEGFGRIGSTQKWLYTHRGPKWATFYSPEALAAQARFFDHFLRDDPTGIDRQPPVRLEVRSSAHDIAAVTHERSWPPPDLEPRMLHADVVNGALAERPPTRTAARRTRRTVRFRYRFDRPTDVIGAYRLRISVSAERDDLTLFAHVSKRAGGAETPFEGSYGFTGDAIAHGWLRASHRAGEKTPPGSSPAHPHDRVTPVPPGAIVLLDLELLPSATRFAAGDELVLEVGDRWLFPTNLLTGSFPARYTRTPRQRWAVHTGPDAETTLEFATRAVR